MSAAAQFLHDYLHVHLVNGAGGDKYLALVFRYDKACFHAVYVQQVIGCLRRYNGRAI